MAKPKINTMKELSETIGVSRPTLSRYFQDPSTVRPSTSKKIQERLSEVDYVYNFLTTRQNRKSTELIGVIVPSYKDLFFASLIASIEESARDLGYTIITQSSSGDSDVEAHAVRKLRSMSVDGAIVAPIGVAADHEAFVAASEDFPLVFVDSRPAKSIPLADFVGTNNVQSIGAIVEYLCRTGDPPVFLGMPHLNANAQDRENAYRAKMLELNHEAKTIEPSVAGGSWEFEAFGNAVMDDCFGRREFTNATILCANDRVAIGAVRAANKHGLFLRGGISGGGLRIAGHDDHPLSQYMFPALTTVAQDVEGIADAAIQLLAQRARGGRSTEAVEFFLEAVMTPRESA
ncbi:MAG: LacI family DNA-binding transcriptional regulator [Boseongicola sp.]|nr:LacI family DNA-binding transcriptional regulator [Boseongicola sp.]MDE0346451.1 LacI family DNA-binding transcriptional regulator [Boseongicola sp.]